MKILVEPSGIHLDNASQACAAVLICSAMSTLAEIESTAHALPGEQKEELLRFLSMHLYSEGELASKIAEDGADAEVQGTRLLDGQQLGMTVERLKAEALRLAPEERFALVELIGRDEDVRRIRQALLAREIRVGLNELDRGNCVECKDDAELRSFFDGVKARGRELLNARKSSAA